MDLLADFYFGSFVVSADATLATLVDCHLGMVNIVITIILFLLSVEFYIWLSFSLTIISLNWRHTDLAIFFFSANIPK